MQRGSLTVCNKVSVTTLHGSCFFCIVGMTMSPSCRGTLGSLWLPQEILKSPILAKSSYTPCQNCRKRVMLGRQSLDRGFLTKISYLCNLQGIFGANPIAQHYSLLNPKSDLVPEIHKKALKKAFLYGTQEIVKRKKDLSSGCTI